MKNNISQFSDQSSETSLVRRETSEDLESLVSCISHTENSLKKITLVNCLIIVVLILVIAANINEGNNAVDCFMIISIKRTQRLKFSFICIHIRPFSVH